MGTLYIDRKDMSVRLDGGALALYSSGCREGLVPLAPIKRVVIASSALVETRVLARLAAMNINVIFLSGRGLSFAGVLRGRLHNNGLLRVRQYEALRNGFALEYAREVVKKKLLAQRDLLRLAALRRPDLETGLLRGAETLDSVLASMKNCATLKNLRGLEGGGAAAYFSAYTSLFAPSLGFMARNRRPPRDPVNALLSLVYTLLFNEALREAQVIGLDPTIGFLHDFEYGRDSLACDLMEPYRPLADELVWVFFRDRVFRREDFMKDAGADGCFLGKRGRKKFYGEYEEWATGVRPLLRDDARALARRIMNHGEEKDAVSCGEEGAPRTEGRPEPLD